MMVGILGGGQLGRMLALAGYPLGLRFRFLDPSPGMPAAYVGKRTPGSFDDAAAIERFVKGVDVVSYEFENVPVDSARLAARHVPVYPPPEALAAAQDRLAEKTLFQKQEIPVPPFAPVGTPAELDEAIARIGLPAVLKTRRGGYDGKGQWVLRTPADVHKAAELLTGVPMILEGFVSFDRELSVIATRSKGGTIVYYPLVENHHREGILRLTIAPAPKLTDMLTQQAEQHAQRILTALNYVGVLAIEFFEKDGRLLANEMAPRVHNSGHWTIEGSETSQFENHLRAVTGLPLGMTTSVGASAMVNIIGTLPDSAVLLAYPGVHLHLYDKKPRPGRKLGHITVHGADEKERDARLHALLAATGDAFAVDPR
jgi:5-(carboxyamino)imidazole ribonucleotide synthase